MLLCSANVGKRKAIPVNGEDNENHCCESAKEMRHDTPSNSKTNDTSNGADQKDYQAKTAKHHTDTTGTGHRHSKTKWNQQHSCNGED